LPITIHQRGEQRVIERQAHADSGQAQAANQADRL
jgi:hypothetical protein